MSIHKRPRGSSVGDILVLTLSKGLSCLGRRMKEAGLEVYNLVEPKLDLMDFDRAVQSGVAIRASVFDDFVHSGEWRVIGNRPFVSESESWMPRRYIRSPIDDSDIQLYHRGELLPATPKDIEGLEEAVILRPQQLLKMLNERLLGTS